MPRKSYLVKVDALRPYVPAHASSLAAMAVKFAIHDPGVTTAITSMHVEEYAPMNIAAVGEDRLPTSCSGSCGPRTGSRSTSATATPGRSRRRTRWPGSGRRDESSTVTGQLVRWEELKPEEFLGRVAERPLAYLPMGMCEPHGHAAAFGLDMIKAEYICDTAAARFGGIVAPSQAYHIHETGFHGTWLTEVVGEINARLAALPPDVVMRTLLFQLRACVNAGFRAIFVLSGQNGAQGDLRLAADEFMKIVPVPVVVRSDPELVRGTFPGDHAGKFELSQLLYIRPELVDMTRLDRVSTDPLGRFAQNPDAHEATAEYGRQVIEAQIDRVGELVDQTGVGPPDLPFLSFDDVEPAWAEVRDRRQSWVSYGSVSG